MKEVSCRAFEIFFRPLAARKIPAATMVEGTGLSLATIRNKHERVSWNDFVQVHVNLRKYFSDDEFVDLGRQHLRGAFLRFVFVIARLRFTPMGFYSWFNKPRQGVGNQLFTCIVPTHHELTESDIEVELNLLDGYEVCPEFFLITRGNFEEMPRLLGYPAAKVEITTFSRGARFKISVPKRTPFLTRIRRVLAWPFTIRAAGRELQEAHETLRERYDQLEDAKAKLDRQATQLRTAHTVNQLVQRDLDLARTLDTIAKVLVDEADFTWAEIKLIDLERTARAGAESHAPLLHRTLTARAGQPLGDLAVAPKPDADRREREELLAFIVPSLSMTLENAIYKTGLERMVEERTGELREARDQLAGTVDQLREAQGARERFFGNISHEIRTPLSIIMLAAGDIEKRAGEQLDARARDGLGAVTDSARKLVRLVDELLLLAAGQEDKLKTRPEPTDLAALLVQLAGAWRPAAEAADIDLVARLPPTLIASVDPVAIERVVTNLVSNAVKYTPPGGRVELELVEGPDGIRLSVLDTGPGISEELAGRLFERFERGEDRRKVGTGIGLSLARQLVEAHGGTVAAHARAPLGCELRVVLPLALRIQDNAIEALPTQLRLVEGEPSTAAPVAAGTVLVPAGLSHGTILLAEDDARLADMIAHLLADQYKVIIAHDGAAALELVKRHQPELLITDVDMPRLDGIELSRRFREHSGDRLAPIIILSAVLDLGTRVAGLEAGAVDYVTKPFDPVELKARVASQFRMRELAIRLHRAEQLSALGMLTSGLAHELRNPANGIVNAIHPLNQLLPADLKTADHPVGQLVDVIAECAEQINHLSRQLLGFRSGSIELVRKPIPARTLVQRALSLAQGALSGVDVRTEFTVADPISVAAPLMTQVLTNLIENAAHAAGRGGWIEVRARAHDHKISFEISDSGPGVPAELRNRVFEPFFTTKPPGIGTGLGLSLSRDIVHRHGGVLEIRDRNARTTFVIELPHDSALDVAANAV